MPHKADDGGKASEANPQHERQHEVWYTQLIDFLFDSVIYNIVTWVAIASSIGLAIYFLSQNNWRGLFWSLVGLLCSIVIVIAIQADQRFFRTHKAVKLPEIQKPSPTQNERPAPVEKPVPTPARPTPAGPTVSGRPEFPGPYDYLKWTDYTEDYFGGAIWRWGYRPEMGDKEPRNIRGVCPDCGAVFSKEMHSRKRDSEGLLKADFICRLHTPIKWLQFKTTSTDPLEPIRVLIRDKLENDGWRETVRRQRDVRDGRV